MLVFFFICGGLFSDMDLLLNIYGSRIVYVASIQINGIQQVHGNVYMILIVFG